MMCFTFLFSLLVTAVVIICSLIALCNNQDEEIHELTKEARLYRELVEYLCQMRGECVDACLDMLNESAQAHAMMYDTLK